MSKKYAKEFMLEQIKEKGMENGQICLDFTDLAEAEEIKAAAAELGYSAEPGEGAGVYWVFQAD